MMNVDVPPLAIRNKELLKQFFFHFIKQRLPKLQLSNIHFVIFFNFFLKYDKLIYYQRRAHNKKNWASSGGPSPTKHLVWAVSPQPQHGTCFRHCVLQVSNLSNEILTPTFIVVRTIPLDQSPTVLSLFLKNSLDGDNNKKVDLTSQTTHQ